MDKQARIDALMEKLLKNGEKEDAPDAYEISRKIIALEPDMPHYYYNHAMLCAEFGNWQEATAVLEKARDLLPRCPIIRRVLAVGLLSTGRFKEGFSEMEWRFNRPLSNSVQTLAYPMYEAAWRLRQAYDKPYWKGEKLDGKTLFIFNEGGFGDMIQNVRYLPRLKQVVKTARIVLEAHPDLKTILENTPGADEVVLGGCKADTLFMGVGKKNCANADYVVSINSLPCYLDPDLMDTPFEFPYVFPQPSNSEAVFVVRECKAPLKIGITWAGNIGHGNDHRRSTFKRNFEALNNIPGVQLFGLQKGDMNRYNGEGVNVNLMEGGDVVNCIDLGDKLTDFNDTTAVLQELDALVTVDTSIAHLAGAMDIPVWMALPYSYWSEWRWQRPWYGSHKVFRHKKEGDWAGTMAEITEDITAIIVPHLV